MGYFAQMQYDRDYCGNKIFYGQNDTCQRFTYSMSVILTPDDSDVIVNLILFLPVGLMAPFIFDRGAFFKTIALSAILSAGLEIMQIISCVGFFTYSDIVINTLGSVLGCNMGSKHCDFAPNGKLIKIQ